MIMSGRTKEQDKTTSLVCWLMDFKQRDELKYGLLTTMLLFLNLKHRRKSMLDGRFVLSLGRKNKIPDKKIPVSRGDFFSNWKPLMKRFEDEKKNSVNWEIYKCEAIYLVG